MSQVIKISHRAVAMLKGIGKSTQEMATKFGITEKEMHEKVLMPFSMVKGRTKKAIEPAYVIELVYDMQDQEVSNKEEAISTN